MISGAKVAKSFGNAPVIQSTMACGSERNFASSERRSGVHVTRPSQAHNVRRSASQPSQAPLASSEMGQPQPPTRCCRPLSWAQPMLPVPITTMPPSAPPWAPTQAAWASVTKTALR
jgi:hypothetical protein